MISNKIEVKAQECDEFIKCVLKRIVNGFDNVVGLNTIILIFPFFQRFVYLQKQGPDQEHQSKVVPGSYHDLKVLIQRICCILRIQKVDNTIPGLLCGPSHVQIHA